MNPVFDVPAGSAFVGGRSDAIQSLNAIVGQIARTEMAVLLVGESGTGKEAYARLIHRLSAYGHLTMKKISCTALESAQVVSQVKAYLQTSAEANQPWIGTLFLDGIDELDVDCQRALGSILPDEESGEPDARQVRLIATASPDLDRKIDTGRFRQELYFRVNGVCLRLPPLRERREDVPVFLEYFLNKRAAELKRQAPVLNKEELELLVSYGWPGNVRELGNLARKMVAIGNAKLAIASIDERPRPLTKTPEVPESCSLKIVARTASRQAERQLILKTLERTRWNRKRAAEELQISYKSLLYKIKQTGLQGTKP